jgi:DNA polymerase V
MDSPDDFADGAPAGRDGPAAPTVRRTSSAFGAPGADSTVRRHDLNDVFIRHQDATFLMRAAGDDMRGAGIADGDTLLVDRALTAGHGSVIIAVIEGELRCRRLERAGAGRGRRATLRLVADEPVAPIEITDDAPLEVWGVVTTVIKSLLQGVNRP